MVLNELNDSNLVVLYQEGNEKAFEKLLKKYEKRVYSYILKMVKDRDLAHDIFQDAFIKVILTLKKGKYIEEGKFLPWVMSITHNLVIDYFRKNSKMRFIEKKKFKDNKEYTIFDFLQLEENTIEDEFILEQIYKDLRSLIELLPEDQREIVKLRHFVGMSFKDIALEKSIPINTALGKMRYALMNMRKIIEAKNVELTLI